VKRRTPRNDFVILITPFLQWVKSQSAASEMSVMAHHKPLQERRG